MAYASWLSAASHNGKIPEQGGINVTRWTNCRWAAQRCLDTTSRFRLATSDKV